MKRCETCIYFKERPYSKGECRFYPPKSPEKGTIGYWPSVYKEEWCGKYTGPKKGAE